MKSTKHDLKGNVSKGAMELRVIETATSTKKEQKHRRKSARKQSIKVKTDAADEDHSPVPRKNKNVEQPDAASKKKTSNAQQNINNLGKRKPANGAVETLNFSELDELDETALNCGTLSTASGVTATIDAARMKPRSSRKR